ncbi:MAG: lmo0937 family membrane protein [Clostridiaceae bacterium]
MWTVIIVLLVLWLLGAFGSRVIPRAPRLGSWVHILVVVAVILLILKLLNVI